MTMQQTVATIMRSFSADFRLNARVDILDAVVSGGIGVGGDPESVFAAVADARSVATEVAKRLVRQIEGNLGRFAWPQGKAWGQNLFQQDRAAGKASRQRILQRPQEGITATHSTNARQKGITVTHSRNTCQQGTPLTPAGNTCRQGTPGNAPR